MVERYLAGKDYRILVVDKRVVAVAERVPAHVVGDGVSTVAELVEIANADPRRGIGHEKVLTRIPLNERTLETLARQGLALDSVPDAGPARAAAADRQHEHRRHLDRSYRRDPPG